MGRVRFRAILGLIFVAAGLLLVVVGAFAGLLGGEVETTAYRVWSNVNEIADKWYAWTDRAGKLVGFFVTVGSGAYAIYQKLYFAEFNMHLRLKEYQKREEERLKDAKSIVGRAVQRPNPARAFDAPIFTDKTLNPVLRELNWGKRPKADASIQNTLEELENQIGLWEGQKKKYELQKQQALLLKGAIAAARAAKISGEQARSENLEALGFFQEAFAISNSTDEDALEYIGHMQVRLGDFPLALQTFEALAAMYPGDGPSLPRARALKFQAEALEWRPQPNLMKANALLLQAVPALPTSARLLEKGEIHELHGRVREKAGIGLATQSYTDAERLYQRIVDGKNGSNIDDDDSHAAKAGLVRVREALQKIRLAPLNGSDDGSPRAPDNQTS